MACICRRNAPGPTRNEEVAFRLSDDYESVLRRITRRFSRPSDRIFFIFPTQCHTRTPSEWANLLMPFASTARSNCLESTSFSRRHEVVKFSRLPLPQCLAYGLCSMLGRSTHGRILVLVCETGKSGYTHPRHTEVGTGKWYYRSLTHEAHMPLETRFCHVVTTLTAYRQSMSEHKTFSNIRAPVRAEQHRAGKACMEYPLLSAQWWVYPHHSTHSCLQQYPPLSEKYTGFFLSEQNRKNKVDHHPGVGDFREPEIGQKCN